MCLVHLLFLSLLLGEILKVIGHVGEPFALSEVDQNPGGSFPLPVPADGAVADVPTRRAAPVGVHQSLPGIVSVADDQAVPAELAPHPDTPPAPADGLHVNGLLSALVTGGPNLPVVDLLAKPVGHFVEHALRNVLRHQHSNVGILDAELTGIAFLVLLSFIDLVIL